MLPHTGGQFIFFKYMYGDFVAFLYGWALLFMIEAGAMAAVAMTFAEYAVRLVSDQPQASALVGAGGIRAIAIGAIVFLSIINYLGVVPGSRLLNVFVVLKVAALAVLSLVIAGQPWGIVYGFGLWAAKIAAAAHLFDPSANAFWSEPVNAATLAQSVFLDVTSITNIGILAGALWIAAGKPAAAAQPMNGTQWAVGLTAGLLLGYSSRLAFGCNIGAMVSGISTGSLHGWIWVPMAFLGSLIGVRVRRRYAF